MANEGLLPLIGGVSGLLFVIYACAVLYLAKRKEKILQQHSVTLARIEGVLIGRKLGRKLR